MIEELIKYKCPILNKTYNSTRDLPVVVEVMVKLNKETTGISGIICPEYSGQKCKIIPKCILVEGFKELK